MPPRTLDMPRPLKLVVLVLALLASACERTPPRSPGETGRLGAPRLRIVQPRPEQRFPIWDPHRGLGRVEVLFELEDPSPSRGTHRIRFQIGDAAPTEIRDPHVRLVRKPGRGTHWLRAWVVDLEGRRIVGPHVTAEGRIHVGPGGA